MGWCLVDWDWTGLGATWLIKSCECTDLLVFSNNRFRLFTVLSKLNDRLHLYFLLFKILNLCLGFLRWVFRVGFKLFLEPQLKVILLLVNRLKRFSFRLKSDKLGGCLNFFCMANLGTLRLIELFRAIRRWRATAALVRGAFALTRVLHFIRLLGWPLHGHRLRLAAPTPLEFRVVTFFTVSILLFLGLRF